MMMVIIGVVAIAALYMFGCDKLGICMICGVRGQKTDKCPGGSTYGPSTSTTTTSTAPALTVAESGGGSGAPTYTGATTTTSAAPTGLVTITQGMEYIANQVVNDINKYTYADLGTGMLLNIKADVLERHKTDLMNIYRYNGQTLQPLIGRALAQYSELILTVTRENHIALNPAAEAMYRANLFAGSPTVVGSPIGLMALIRS